jgi:hypothetical protein
MSAPAQSSTELIDAYLDAVIRKDVSAVDRYFHPNVEYMVNGTPPRIQRECCLPFLRSVTAPSHGSVSITAEKLSKGFWRTCTAIWR